ncbi:OmpA family protein [Spirosoma sp. BT702]|uniref:OmpA family protein n=1 Tax=Spirosoma profusum TaxID=2771354 RepID=A0A926XWL7_9BACT|nr:OmpA family protein [Spirosoma profusum]MBD2701440.1 OmpA family protein [Spirosoma profusum]
MATTLLDQLRSIFTTPSVADLARLLNEANAPVQKAVDGLLPAIVSGVVNRAQSDDGAATLNRLLTSTPFDTDPSLKKLAENGTHRQKAAETGNQLLSELIPNQSGRLAESTAQYSGISLESATTLTGLVMSILMGYLHKQVKARNLTRAQLVALLASESDTVRGLIPAALAGSIGWLIGSDTGATTSANVSPAPAIGPTDRETETKAAGFPLLRWLLIGLGLLILLFLLLRGCNRKDEKTTTTGADSTSSMSTATDTIASDLDGSEATPQVRVGVDLPGGRKLNVAENSFNYTLAQFLATKGGQVPKVFTFDNLTFETNSARITSAAQPNVDDLIQIMQAYPTLAIGIEGNTDSTGDDAINDPLSAERADAVKAALVNAGIEGPRISTRERGDTKPVASNQTEAGRQQNRRIDIVVTKL